MYVGATADDMIRDYYSQKPKQKLDFKQAIEDYADEILTGLTKEERAAIDAIMKKYMEDNPGDVEGYKNLYKALLKKFGFKGETDEYADADTVAAVVAAGSEPGQSPVSCAQTARAAGVDTEAEKVTDANGETYIVIKTQNGAVFRMKVSDAGEGSGDNDSTEKKIEAYEKNLAVV